METLTWLISFTVVACEFSGTEKERILKATSKAVEPASAVKSSANAKLPSLLLQGVKLEHH